MSTPVKERKKERNWFFTESSPRSLARLRRLGAAATDACCLDRVRMQQTLLAIEFCLSAPRLPILVVVCVRSRFCWSFWFAAERLALLLARTTLPELLDGLLTATEHVGVCAAACVGCRVALVCKGAPMACKSASFNGVQECSQWCVTTETSRHLDRLGQLGETQLSDTQLCRRRPPAISTHSCVTTKTQYLHPAVQTVLYRHSWPTDPLRPTITAAPTHHPCCTSPQVCRRSVDAVQTQCRVCTGGAAPTGVPAQLHLYSGTLLCQKENSFGGRCGWCTSAASRLRTDSPLPPLEAGSGAAQPQLSWWGLHTAPLQRLAAGSAAAQPQLSPHRLSCGGAGDAPALRASCSQPPPQLSPDRVSRSSAAAQAPPAQPRWCGRREPVQLRRRGRCTSAASRLRTAAPGALRPHRCSRSGVSAASRLRTGLRTPWRPVQPPPGQPRWCGWCTNAASRLRTASEIHSGSTTKRCLPSVNIVNTAWSASTLRTSTS